MFTPLKKGEKPRIGLEETNIALYSILSKCQKLGKQPRGSLGLGSAVESKLCQK